MNYPFFPTGGGAKPASSASSAAKKPNESPAPTVGAPASDPPKARTPRRRVEVVETYFGADGRPTKRKGLGAARVARRYDESGNKIEEAYFNAEGKPTLRKDIGVARIAWRYDERGNPVEAEFFAADGTPIERETTELAEKALSEEG
jgi:YD repeat-containing protein